MWRGELDTGVKWIDCRVMYSIRIGSYWKGTGSERRNMCENELPDKPTDSDPYSVPDNQDLPIREGLRIRIHLHGHSTGDSRWSDFPGRLPELLLFCELCELQLQREYRILCSELRTQRAWGCIQVHVHPDGSILVSIRLRSSSYDSSSGVDNSRR